MCPSLIALSASVQPLQAPLLASLGRSMYQAVRKLFFTECRCAQDAPRTYEQLFAQLDANKDGKVDVSELRAGLAAMGVRSGKGAAQVRVPGDRGGQGTEASRQGERKRSGGEGGKKKGLGRHVRDFTDALPEELLRFFILQLCSEQLVSKGRSC